MVNLLLKLIPFLIMLFSCSVSGRSRPNVVFKGTTMDPIFRRRTDRGSVYCPLEYPFTYSNRSKCCKTNIKPNTTACPLRKELDFFLREFDSDDCCNLGNSVGCPDLICKSRHFKNVVNSFCPPSHPLSFARGSRCCGYQYRDDACSSGSGGTKLRMADNVDCCANWIPCTSFNGLPPICQDAKRHCKEPSIVSSSEAYGSSFKVENVLNDHFCERNIPGSYFLFKNPDPNEYFTVDIGCELMLTSIYLKNTNNGNQNNRVSAKFEIDFSEDNTNWDNGVIASELQDSRYKHCQVPLENFLLPTRRKARYIRFRILTTIGGDPGGLQHINWGIEVLEKYPRSSYVECPKAVIDSHDGFYQGNPLFDVNNVFIHDHCEWNDQGKYWLFHDFQVGKGFIIDLKCTRILKSVSLKNTHNSFSNDRATNGFRIEISDDKVLWTKAIQGELTYPFGMKCGTPLETFHVSHLRETRYIKFVIESHYGNGAGLQYITWDLA